MAEETWERLEGMIIANDLAPEDVASALKKMGIIAQMEWFDETPSLMALVVVTDGTHVGVAHDAPPFIVAGPTHEDFAESIATQFAAEFRVGDMRVDRLVPDAKKLAAADFSDEQSDMDAAGDDNDPASDTYQQTRIVELGHTPASSVPLLAALEGVDLADMELGGDLRALLAVAPSGRLGWNFGELPLVSLIVDGDEFKILLVTDDDPEHVLSTNCKMRRHLVAGALGEGKTVPQDIERLVSDRDDLAQIATYVPGSDPDALYDATNERGKDAIYAVVRALALPDVVADFLAGVVEPEAIEEATMHLAKGISNAIGRSVDIMLTEPDSPSLPLWEAYHSIAVKRPWVVRMGASLEAAAGAAIVAGVIRSSKPRAFWKKCAGLVGALLVVDSVAELSLAKFLMRREERREMLHKDD